MLQIQIKVALRKVQHVVLLSSLLTKKDLIKPL